MNERMKGMIIAIIASSAWGFMGLFTRRLNEYGLSVFEMSFIRSAITAVFLFIVMMIFDKAALKIQKRDILLFLALGGTKVISDACLFTANLNIPLALSSIIQLTYPYFVLILSFFIFSEKIQFYKIAAVFLGFTGCVLVADVTTGGDVKFIGILLALASSFVTAVNIICNKFGTNRKIQPSALVFYAFLVSAIFTAPLSDVPKIVNIASSDSTALLLMVGLGVLLTAIPHTLDNWSLSRVEASIISIIGMMEAIVSAIVGVVVFNEVPTELMDLGIILAIIAIIIVSRPRKEDSHRISE